MSPENQFSTTERGTTSIFNQDQISLPTPETPAVQLAVEILGRGNVRGPWNLGDPVSFEIEKLPHVPFSRTKLEQMKSRGAALVYIPDSLSLDNQKKNPVTLDFLVTQFPQFTEACGIRKESSSLENSAEKEMVLGYDRHWIDEKDAQRGGNIPPLLQETARAGWIVLEKNPPDNIKFFDIFDQVLLLQAFLQKQVFYSEKKPTPEPYNHLFQEFFQERDRLHALSLMETRKGLLEDSSSFFFRKQAETIQRNSLIEKELSENTLFRNICPSAVELVYLMMTTFSATGQRLFSGKKIITSTLSPARNGYLFRLSGFDEHGLVLSQTKRQGDEQLALAWRPPAEDHSQFSHEGTSIQETRLSITKELLYQATNEAILALDKIINSLQSGSLSHYCLQRDLAELFSTDTLTVSLDTKYWEKLLQNSINIRYNQIIPIKHLPQTKGGDPIVAMKMPEVNSLEVLVNSLKETVPDRYKEEISALQNFLATFQEKLNELNKTLSAWKFPEIPVSEAKSLIGEENFIGNELVDGIFESKNNPVPTIEFSHETLDRARELGMKLVLFRSSDNSRNPLDIECIQNKTKSWSPAGLVHTRGAIDSKSTPRDEWVLIWDPSQSLFEKEAFDSSPQTIALKKQEEDEALKEILLKLSPENLPVRFNNKSTQEMDVDTRPTPVEILYILKLLDFMSVSMRSSLKNRRIRTNTLTPNGKNLITIGGEHSHLTLFPDTNKAGRDIGIFLIRSFE
jgi:hypothetical protein